jgi:hypothetical protein
MMEHNMDHRVGFRNLETWGRWSVFGGFFGLLAFTVLGSCNSSPAQKQVNSTVMDSVSWVWEDDFTQDEKDKLVVWISEVYETTDRLLGPFPFSVSIHFYRSGRSSEPVPWAHTRRSGQQSLHFHIDPSFSLEEFRADWTAPHEISHLALPFLGRENSWFAEGFATYMQSEIMVAMNVMTQEQMREKNREKIEYNQRFFKDKAEPFHLVCRELVRKNHNYPAMYWGSVTFFVRMEQYLQENKQFSLTRLIRDYQKAGRMTDTNLQDVIASLDDLIGKPVCRELMDMYTQQPATEVFAGLEL